MLRFRRRGGKYGGQLGVARRSDPSGRGMRVDDAGARVGAERSGPIFKTARHRHPRIRRLENFRVRKRVGTEAGNARRALGRGTYVSEKDFLVFLCRLETAMRAASCEGGRRVERQRAVRGSGRRLKARRHATWLLREKSVAMGAPGKRSRGAARGVRGAHTHLRVVRMLRGHGRGGLRGELVELPRGDALVHAHGHLLGDEHAVRRSSGRAGTGKRSARGRGARKGRVKRGRSVHGCATDSCTSSRAG